VSGLRRGQRRLRADLRREFTRPAARAPLIAGAPRLPCVELAERGVDALVVPRADEYLGEYLPPHNERLRWLTGFTGSAGMAVVLADRAAIFVDGRYTVQVRRQVSASRFTYHGLPARAPVDWLVRPAPAGARVLVDPRLCTALRWYEATRERWRPLASSWC
jgi:Xaa-Pro aminopeptidase